ncbi:SYP61, partial [Symbiodinium sp. KB8]
ELRELLDQRERLAAASASTSQVSRSLKEKQRALTKRMRDADATLRSMRADPTSYSLSSGELSRLSADFKQLQEEQASIKGAVQNPPSGDRTALMAGATAGFAGAGSDRGAETARSKNMTNTQMMAQFEEDTKEQDAILDDLEAGADRLAHVGRAIGDEASAHIRLLDDLDPEMDTARDKLRTETKHIKKVTVKTQFCWLYVVMCLLVLVLAVLVFMRWG